MITIVVIEDEFYIRKAICKYCEQIGDPYTIIGEASDGMTGLALIREKTPDIAFVDISMPVMNGLEMIELAHEEQIPTRMIILTGYNDFNYAQTAIHYEVKGYLLKPIKITDIKNSLDSLRTTIEKEQTLLKKSHEYQLMEMLIDGGLAENCQILAEHLGYPVTHTYFRTAVIEFFSKSSSAFSIRESIMDHFRKTFSQDAHSALAITLARNKICILFSADLPYREHIESTVTFWENTDMQFRIGVSSPFSTLMDMKNYYEEAERRLNSHILNREKYCVIYDTEKDSDPIWASTIESIAQFSNIMDLENENQICTFLSETYKRLQSASMEDVYFSTSFLLSVIKRNSPHNTDSTEQVDILNLIQNDVSDICKYVTLKALNTIKLRTADKASRTMLIRSVNEYINNHYSDCSLRITDVSKECYTSTSYLCSIYRNTTGKTILQQILDVRMKHAEELIQNGEKDVNQISIMCGYNDSAYFCKCFKKYFNQTPKQYMDRVIREHL